MNDFRGILMDLNNLSVFDYANQNMKYLQEKQRVVAVNIANSTTPGYLAQDVEKPDFGSELSSRLAMKTTNSKHLNGIGGANFTNKVYTPKPTTPLTIDGNGVVIEEQLNEAAKASGEYNRISTIYNTYRNMVKTANTRTGI